MLLMNVKYGISAIILFCLAKATAFLDQNHKPALFDGENWFGIDVNSDTSLPKPLEPISDNWKDPNTEIFIGISQFRDAKRCANTLKDLFNKASKPDRIRIGIIEQFGEGESSCKDEFCHGGCKLGAQIESITMSKFESKGPSFARYLISSEMISNSEFCLQIDSHSLFVQDWDVVALEMWGSINNEYAILSTQVPDLSYTVSPDNSVPHLCEAEWANRGIVRNKPPKAAAYLDKPILSNLWSAGFSFSKCHAEIKVPADPHLHQIFDGEEFSKYARFWTRGYDVYTPNKVIVMHDYQEAKVDPYLGPARPGGPQNFDWTNNGMSIDYKREMFDNSFLRISTLLGTPDGRKDAEAVASLTQYGLGTKRTLDQLIQFTGIDLRKKSILPDNKCQKNLKWVPYEIDKSPDIDTGDVWGFYPEIRYAGDQNIPLKSGSKTSVDNPSNIIIKNEQKHGMKRSKNRNKSSINSNNNISESVRVESGELWYIFQLIDGLIDYIENSLSVRMGLNKGHKALQIILLILPVFLAILCSAVYLVLSKEETDSITKLFDTRVKKV